MQPSRTQRGLSLVEIVVVLGIVAMLVMMAMPTFTGWVINSRIRSTAEAVQAGLQLAKAEAVARNTRVRFQLTSTLDNGCVAAADGLNWVINLDPNADPTEVEGSCDSAPDDANAPFILQKRPGATSGNTQVAANAASLVFNGLGRPLPIPGVAGNLTIAISNPAAGTCTAVGGELTCLNIVVTPAGQIRMCNPAFPATDPQGC